MADSGDDPSAGSTESSPEERRRAWEQLRELLVGEDIARLAQLEQRVAEQRVEPQDVGPVLADAIRARAARAAGEDTDLENALAPALEGAIERSVRKDPQKLADVLFPVLGPAIRKSIRATLASMVEGFNRALENSLSPRSLKWRLEARRSGRPFAEVVLLHTLVWRAEQVFLIHAESGVLLEHVVAPTVQAEDPDLVSAMLKALEDFAADSFRGGERDPISQVQFGDLTLLVAAGPRALVAAVVRGNPPAEYEQRLQETIESLHAELGDELAAFDGDAAPFAKADPALEGLLGQELAPRRRSMSTLVVWVLLATLLGWVLWRAVGGWVEARRLDRQREDQQQQALTDLTARLGALDATLTRLGDASARHDETFARLTGLVEQAEGLAEQAAGEADAAASRTEHAEGAAAAAEALARRVSDDIARLEAQLAADADFRAAVDTLQHAPGLLVLDAGRGPDGFQLTGLRDVDATHDPDAILAAHGIDPAGVHAHWEPWHSLEPDFVLARAARALQPPVGVALQLDGDVLAASGAAPRAWIAAAVALAPGIPGVTRLDASGLSDLESASIDDASAGLERVAIFFPPGSSRAFLDDDDRASLSLMLAQLEAAARGAGLYARLTIHGAVEDRELGHGERNLRQRRVESVRDELELLHTGGHLVYAFEGADGDAAEGAASPGAGGAADNRRRVWFSVDTTGGAPPPAGDG